MITMRRFVRPPMLALATLGSLIGSLSRGGRWFLVPFVGVLVVASILLVVVSVIEYVAPFVYTVF